MLLEYAIEQKTDQIVHIDEVKNGARCGCICKNCGDELVAKNNGKKLAHHFAHKNIEESRECLMTQLHIAIQYYFLSLEEIEFPNEKFKYKDVELNIPAKRANIYSSKMEYRVGKYIADIFLDTDIGEFYIEIHVTHECDPEKIEFYKSNKFNSVELSFNQSKGYSIQEWIDLIKSNQIPFEWFHYQEIEKMIFAYEQKIIDQLYKKRQKRIKKIEMAINKLKNKKEVFLPSIYHELNYNDSGYEYQRKALIYTKKNIDLKHLDFIKREGDLFILQGCIEHNNSLRKIWIMYSISEEEPKLIDFPNDSIIIRSYPIDNDNPVWKWLRYPSVKKKIAYENEVFIKWCQEETLIKSRTIYISNKLRDLSESYINSKEDLFSRDYNKWHRWMKKNRVFTPTAEEPRPKYSKLLKSNIDFSFLWMFQTWSVLSISLLIELLDNVPINTPIGFSDLFDRLSDKLPLKPEFYELEKIAEQRIVQVCHKRLIYKKLIISEALNLVAAPEAIYIGDFSVVRISSLIDILKTRFQ